GVSTRLIGAIIMTHGDQRGLVFPPKVAPIQTIIVPIAAKKGGVNEACAELEAKLKNAGVRVKTDYTDNSPGWKFKECEKKGVPVRVEIGPRDLEQGKIMLFRRDTLEKISVSIENAVEEITALLATIQKDMLAAALQRREERIVYANSVEELLKGVETGNFVKAGWCEDRACEEQIKAQTAATSRVYAEGETAETCVCCGKKAKHMVIFARAY
ncbi:MAG: proline--tRNA ligase, partial [Clostridia bacterium]|nr:proline--tRNA ligase [Clostridia bacterium]